jgi:hypothetical protein
MQRVGVGRFAKVRKWCAFARVELILHDLSGEATTTFACSGEGWVRQGDIETVSATGYVDWKRGATAGIQFAFRLAGEAPRSVTVTKIEGMTTDTSPAAVGAAAALATLNALAVPVPSSFQSLVEEVVFTSAGLDAEFSL